MINKETLKWFVRGFALTSLILLGAVMVVRPHIGWAQGGEAENPNANSLVVEDEPSQAGTDGPESLEPGAVVVDSGEPLSNWEAMVVDDASSQAGADGPESLEPGAVVVDSGEPLSNWEAMVVDDASSQAGADGPESLEPGAVVVEGDEPLSNWEAIVVDDAPSDPGTDGPEGDLGGMGAADGVTGQGYGSPLVIPAADFSSDGFDPDGFSFSFGGGYIRGSGTNPCLKAPAYLPNGATVTSFYASLYDNAAGNITVNLWRVNRITGATDEMAAASTTTDSTSIQNRPDSTISNPTVSYPDYAYYVTTCLNSTDHRLYSIRIYYTES